MKALVLLLAFIASINALVIREQVDTNDRKLLDNTFPNFKPPSSSSKGHITLGESTHKCAWTGCNLINDDYDISFRAVVVDNCTMRPSNPHVIGAGQKFCSGEEKTLTYTEAIGLVYTTTYGWRIQVTTNVLGVGLKWEIQAEASASYTKSISTTTLTGSSELHKKPDYGVFTPYIINYEMVCTGMVAEDHWRAEADGKLTYADGKKTVLTSEQDTLCRTTDAGAIHLEKYNFGSNRENLRFCALPGYAGVLTRSDERDGDKVWYVITKDNSAYVRKEEVVFPVQTDDGKLLSVMDWKQTPCPTSP